MVPSKRWVPLQGVVPLGLGRHQNDARLEATIGFGTTSAFRSRHLKRQDVPLLLRLVDRRFPR